MKKLSFLILISTFLTSCNEASVNKSLPEEAHLFYNFYILNNDGNRIPRGLFISKKDDGSFYGKFFNPMREKDIYDVHLVKASKDTLELTVEGIDEPWIITDLEIWDKKATLISNDGYYKKLELQTGPLAAQAVIDFDEELYDRIINDGNPINQKKSTNKTLPKYSEIRSLLINSKNPNEAEELLGEADEVYEKRLLTYSLYYFAAKLNNDVVHVKVTYDNSSDKGLLGHVQDVTYHKPGSIIKVGRFNSVQSPKKYK